MANTGLGTALRHWRDRVTPQAAGLPAGGRRRAAGLRREELAQLAGISADYVIRLEQGRATTPSAQVVEALARALRLTGDERTHLFRLAGLAPPGPGTVPRHITPGVHRMLDRLAGTPVAVFDAAWHQLLANPLYTALMGEWHGEDLNGVRRTFLNPNTRVRDTPESRAALQSALVADLRWTAGRYPDDRDLRSLVAELRRRSPRFAGLWESGAVGHHEAARKTIDHPDVGALTLDCDVLSVAGSDLRLMVYSAEPGTEDADRLALLGVVGTQSLVDVSFAAAPGTRVGRTIRRCAMPAPDRTSLEQHLSETEYPCGREELLRRAAAAGGGDSVLGSLGGLPDSDSYDNFDAVWEAVNAKHIGGAP